MHHTAEEVGKIVLAHVGQVGELVKGEPVAEVAVDVVDGVRDLRVVLGKLLHGEGLLTDAFVASVNERKDFHQQRLDDQLVTRYLFFRFFLDFVDYGVYLLCLTAFRD